MSVLHFGYTECIVSVGKNLQNSLQSFNAARKTSASTTQNRDIVPQIGINAFYATGIFFIVDISDMLTRIDYINISCITVGTVIICRRRIINQCLNTIRGLVISRIDTDNLTGNTTDKRDNIAIFPRFGCSFLSDKPIKFVYF